MKGRPVFFPGGSASAMSTFWEGAAIARLEADASSNKLLHLLEAEGVAVDEDGKGLFVELLLLLDLGDGQVAKAHRQEEGTSAPQRDNLSQLDK